jgi:hypothetical protein
MKLKFRGLVHNPLNALVAAVGVAIIFVAIAYILRAKPKCGCGCSGNGCNNPACPCTCGRCGIVEPFAMHSAAASSSASNKYVAKSKYATVSYKVESSVSDAIRIHAKFGDLTGVSAVHIHTNDNGKPGAIIAWLATTSEWKAGVLQNTPGKNAPCCGSNNRMCFLAGPASTPQVQSVANTEMNFYVKNEFCKASAACPWINNGTILVIHGMNFQRVENGCLTDAPAGIDVLQAIPFSVSK